MLIRAVSLNPYGIRRHFKPSAFPQLMFYTIMVRGIWHHHNCCSRQTIPMWYVREPYGISGSPKNPRGVASDTSCYNVHVISLPNTSSGVASNASISIDVVDSVNIHFFSRQKQNRSNILFLSRQTDIFSCLVNSVIDSIFIFITANWQLQLLGCFEQQLRLTIASTDCFRHGQFPFLCQFY